MKKLRIMINFLKNLFRPKHKELMIGTNLLIHLDNAYTVFKKKPIIKKETTNDIQPTTDDVQP